MHTLPVSAGLPLPLLLEYARYRSQKLSNNVINMSSIQFDSIRSWLRSTDNLSGNLAVPDSMSTTNVYPDKIWQELVHKEMIVSFLFYWDSVLNFIVHVGPANGNHSKCFCLRI